jgi:hypothetical protein
MDFYRYRLQIRDPPHSPEIYRDSVTWGGDLAQQYWVDEWVKIEQERLNFIRHNQEK